MGLFIIVGLILSASLLLLDLSNIFVLGSIFTIFKPLFFGVLIDLFVYVLFTLFLLIFDRK